ncbi:MAG: DUF4810 domain-containing protein [Nitrospirota bacterium]
MGKTTTVVVLVLLTALLVPGCLFRQPLIYEWGSYEDQVYAMLSSGGGVPVEQQIQELERDLDLARSYAKPVPPGYHAHLGYLYYQAGKADQALQSFETEKKVFPESAQYMDLLISRMTRT